MIAEYLNSLNLSINELGFIQRVQICIQCKHCYQFHFMDKTWSLGKKKKKKVITSIWHVLNMIFFFCVCVCVLLKSKIDFGVYFWHFRFNFLLGFLETSWCTTGNPWIKNILIQTICTMTAGLLLSFGDLCNPFSQCHQKQVATSPDQYSTAHWRHAESRETNRVCFQAVMFGANAGWREEEI